MRLKNHIFTATAILLIVIYFNRCEKKPASPELEAFTLNVTVTSAGTAIEYASVILNNPVSEREEIDGISYVKLTRFKTGNNGKTSIAELPLKNVLGEIINYKVTIYKSGYNGASKEAGEITEDNVSIEIQLDVQSDTTDIRLALLDYEQKYRASDLFIKNNILFTDITGNLNQVSLSNYKILCLGYDASKYVDFVTEFIANKTKIIDFVGS